MSASPPTTVPGPTRAAEAMQLQLPALQPATMAIGTIAPAPCTGACPAGINVKGYVSLIAQGHFEDALRVIRERCPLPSICGRVCHHPCEVACERGDEPVAIRALKRFVADHYPLPPPVPPPERGKAVAVVGSGPAGLTAAYDLRMAGHPVAVLEAMPELGGMLRYGIADYRLPPAVLDAEIDVLRQMGITFHTWVRIERPEDIEDLLADEFGAVLLAVGAQRGRRLGVPGEEESSAVEDALTFLRRVNDGDRTPLPGKVVVIGGGSTAVEAARTALRVGASSVEILYRRSRQEVRAADDEVDAAEMEGVRFRFLAAPVRAVVEEGRLRGLECLQVALGAPDADGRRRPIPMPGSEFLVKADHVLAAVGQEADLTFLPSGSATEGGRLLAEADTLMTSLPGVFAAGDVVTGPATVVDAIAAGHRAAESIAHYLRTGEPGSPGPAPVAPPEYGLADLPPRPASRIHPEMIGPQPGREFTEVEQAYSAEEAIAEASRCLRCGPCGECVLCAPDCGRRHLLVRTAGDDGESPGSALLVRAPASSALGLAAGPPASGRLWSEGVVPAGSPVEVLPMRVRYLPERCRGCGLCPDVCHFDALSMGAGPEAKVVFDPARCRGCDLCAAVCPTGALLSNVQSFQWWSALLDRVFGDAGERQPDVVLTCEGRGATEGEPDAEVLVLRCVGQVHPGMLLELYRRGARRITVDSCPAGACRFGTGGALAEQHAGDARALLRVLGGDEEAVVCRAGGAGSTADPEAAPVPAAVSGGVES